MRKAERIASGALLLALLATACTAASSAAPCRHSREGGNPATCAPRKAESLGPRLRGTDAAQLLRERIPINEGWRFHRGDPDGLTASLDYDVRPDIVQSADGKAADARPEAAADVKAGSRRVLKPWILPTANAFIRDRGARHVRPANEPDIDVAFARADFDDGHWQRVDLPHDWAIAGPFLVEGPHGGMGRLPSAGVGWYRRTLDIEAGDRGRRIFLDVDGAMSHATVWVNGKLAGGWPYGYTSWRLDLTPHLAFGARNQLAIRLDNPAESARWYPGGEVFTSHTWR